MKHRRWWFVTVLAATGLLVGVVSAAEPTDDFQSSVQALEWRNIGPFNGGRGTSVVGHPTDTNVFWFGHSSGGLWKTEDAGAYWMPVGEGQFRYASVGAIALYEKDPNIMYVGLGEPQMRQSVSWGDGMYKTVDGGETWEHIGLDEARQISQVVIHPDNPDVVYVGSMGHTWGPSPERGVFRTKDGGKNWEKVLFKSEGAGVIDLIMSPEDPNVLFAAVWEFDRKAWGAKIGGAESGLWKSSDGGDTWTDITRFEGMPKGTWGRVGLTMSAADPKRVYALIDNETQQGLYRSDDLGDTWRFVSGDAGITARPFYFYHVEADPSNADHLWVPSNKMWSSKDGGETWVLEPGVKDDFHDIWIDPKDSNRMIATCDGGTQVTLTGGKTWSGFANQSGAQMYRVDTDDQFPYGVYGNTQDLIVYRVPSASRWGGIPLHMTDFIGSGETARAIPKPGDPNIVYSLATGATFGGATMFTVNNIETGQAETRPIWPEILFGISASEFKYRFNWQAPFLVSPHDSKTIYMAGNLVFRTRDEGMLFVGTETGIYVSIDDGKEWRRLNLNMPPLPVHDIEVKGNDLVIATHGMGFWVLDEIGPLRQFSWDLAQTSAHLFKPGDHTRFGYNWWGEYGGGPASDKKYYFVRNAEPGYTFYERGTVNGERKRDFINAGDAKPLGVIIDYLLSEDAKEVSLSILDAQGDEVRTWGIDEIPTERFKSFDNRGYEQELVTGEPKATVSKGLNQFIWDMRYPNVSAIPGVPPVLLSPIAKPGTYQVRLTVDGESQTQPFELKPNPNEVYTREQTDEKGEFWMQLYAKTDEAIQSVLAAKAAQEKVATALEGDSSDALKTQAEMVDKLAHDYVASMVATGATLVQIVSEPTKPLSKLVTLHNIMEHSEGPPNQPMREVYAKVAAEIDEGSAAFKAQLDQEMAKFDELAGG